MSKILYVYKDQVYVNLTNKCSAQCIFCIRNKKSGVGSESLFLEKEPTLEEIIKEMDAFPFEGYRELVFCGYGEPTCALDNLVASAEYFKRRHGQKIRVNTNGLGNLYHHRDILPELAEVVDGFSISLNAPNERRYQELVRPPYEHAYDGMVRFASDAKNLGKEVTFTVVSILSEKEIGECRIMARKLGIPLKVRKYDE